MLGSCNGLAFATSVLDNTTTDVSDASDMTDALALSRTSTSQMMKQVMQTPNGVAILESLATEVVRCENDKTFDVRLPEYVSNVEALPAIKASNTADELKLRVLKLRFIRASTATSI